MIMFNASFGVTPYLMVCMWFARCTNMTSDAASHPIMGPLPICPRCAERMEITPQYTIMGPHHVVPK